MTIVEIQANTLLPIFRVVIRQSCGNPELDSLVTQAVRRRLEEGKASLFTEKAFAATSGGSVILEVDWRLQDLAASNNGAMP